MRVLCSRVAASGHVVVLRLPEGAGFLGRFADEDQPRDLTAHAANLLLAGALDAAEAAGSGRPEPADSVPVAQVSYVEPVPEPGALRPAASVTWVHLPTGEADDFPAEQVLGLLVRGLAAEVTAAVAAEAAEVPDSPAGITDEDGERA